MTLACLSDTTGELIALIGVFVGFVGYVVASVAWMMSRKP